MQVWNQTRFPHEFTMAMDKAGHEYLLLVVKGTFDFPDEPGGPVRQSPRPRCRWSWPTSSPARPASPPPSGRPTSPSASRAAT